MKLRTPKFWYRDKDSPATVWERILSPLSLIYRSCDTHNRKKQQTQSVSIPVLCVGNITAGGSGKTPTSIALAKLLKNNALAKKPYFVTRGYGGSNTKLRCISVHDNSIETGDEPLLLVKHCNTIISVNRYDGANMAHGLGSDLVILDDGFQNNTLKKDISILVIDGKRGLGNGKILPAGPLREKPQSALKRTDIVIIIGEDSTNIKKEIPKDIPIFIADIKPNQANAQFINTSQKLVAFAGLGMPEKFKDTLIQYSYNVIDFFPFPDHYKYKAQDIERLINIAKHNDAKLITTEKDILRIPEQYKKQIETLPIYVHFRNEDELINYLTKKLNHIRQSKENPL